MDEQLERDADDVSDPVLHPDFLAAVRRVTEAALAADEPGLIRPPTEWFAMVQRHMPHARIGSFLDEAVEPLFDAPPAIVAVAQERMLSEGELNQWFTLIVDVWNNTPQLDRGGLTPLEIAGGRRPEHAGGSRRRAKRRRR